jgi:DNA-binding winged helix-turn-helix (wHTH) protein
MRSESEGTIDLPGFVLDVQQLRDRSGARVPLPPQAFVMLQYMAQRAGRLVTKDELMQAVWRGRVVTDDSLVQCIRVIRRALGDDAHRIVRTEPKRGYRLIVTGAGTTDAPAPSARFRQDIRFAASSGGVRIAYALSGSRPPLVRGALDDASRA